MKRKSSQPELSLGIAACAIAVSPEGEIQLTPCGEFRSIDGRPVEAPSWIMDAAAAKDVIAFCSARQTPFLIDYEHQSMRAKDNGKEAPAAGWFAGTALAWREGKGLFAKADWTQRANDYIANNEYKFISPVILFEKVTGRVKGILSAALTNTPAIDGMDEVLACAAASLFNDSHKEEQLSMEIDELLESLRWMLNLPTLATAEEITAELQKAVTAIKAAPAAAAAGFSITAYIDGLQTQVATLSAATPDLAKFVPVETMQALQTEVAALRNEKAERDVDVVVSAALSTGKLLPPQERWARDLGKINLAALNQYLETAQPIDALNNTQTGGKPPAAASQEGGLSETELAMCSSMGVSAEDFKKTKSQLAIN
jgi:phage I-like protein